MGTFNDFRVWGQYFVNPIRVSWDDFIDLLQTSATPFLKGDYVWSSALTISDPGSGKVNIDSGSPTTASTLCVSETDDGGSSMSLILGSIKNGDYISIQSRVTATNEYSFHVNGTPVDHGGWWEFPITYSDDSGSLSNGELVTLRAVPYAPSEFTALLDTPSTYSGEAHSLLIVNDDEDALIFTQFPEDDNFPQGFVNTNLDTNIGIEAANGTRYFFIEPTGSNFSFYFKGTKYTKDSHETIDITSLLSSPGEYGVYYDENQTLQIVMSPDPMEMIKDYVYIADLYSNGDVIVVNDERHGLMPWQAHKWMHISIGTLYLSGLSPTDITADASGNNDEDAEFGSAEGSILDEDLTDEIEEIDSTTGDWWTAYKIGSEWKFELTGAPSPVIVDGGIPQYNLDTAGTWTLEDVSTSKFFLMHIFATNQVGYWDESGYVYTNLTGNVAVVGENEYLTKAEARDGANSEISNLTTLGLQMPEFLAVATVIFQRKGTNSYNCAVVSTLTGDDYVSWLGSEISPGTAPGSHPALTGRSTVNSHPASAIATDVSGFDWVLSSADDNVQKALDTLNDIFSGHVIPKTTSSFDLGSASNKWRYLYLLSLYATNLVSTNTITELTSGSGVTIDSVLLKDAGATFNANVNLQSGAALRIYDSSYPGTAYFEIKWPGYSSLFYSTDGTYELAFFNNGSWVSFVSNATEGFVINSLRLQIRCINKTGTSIAAYKVVYINGYDGTSGLPTVALADADAASTATGKLLMTQAIMANNGEQDLLERGPEPNLSGLTLGVPYFLSTTAGEITTTQPSSSADIIRVVGYALSATKFQFEPSGAWVEFA